MDGHDETALAVVSGDLERLRDPLRGLIDAFLSGRSPRTVEAYAADLEDFRRFVRATDIDEAAHVLLSGTHGEANAMALAYKSRLVDRELSPATINRRLAALRSLVKLGRTLGMVGWSLEVSNAKGSAYRDTRGPGRNAVRMMMEICTERHDEKGVRDLAILHLLYDLGLRRGEVVRLDLEDINLEKGTIAVLGKGRTQKEILSLPGATQRALGAWLQNRGIDTGPLFRSCDRAHKGRSRLTGSAV